MNPLTMIKQYILLFLIFMGLSTNLFAAFTDNKFTVADLNNTTMYDVFFEDQDMNNIGWFVEGISFNETQITMTNSDTNVSDVETYTIMADGNLSFPTPASWNEGTGTQYIKITSQDADKLTICFEDNLADLANCTVGGEFLYFDQTVATTAAANFNQALADSMVKVAEYDNDSNAQYSAGDTIYIQYSINIAISELVTNKVSAEDINENPITLAAGTNIVPVNSGVDISTMPGFVAIFNDGTDANTFVITLGSGTTVSTGDNIIISSTGITALSMDSRFPLLAIADVASLSAQVTDIRNQLNAETDMPADLRAQIEALLTEADALLAATTLDENALTAKLAEIYAIVDTIGDDEAYLYGANASTVTGTVTLPGEVTWTAEENCFDNATHMPTPECNAVFIDLMAKDGEWLGSTMVDANDSSYTLYFRELATSETIDAVVQVHIRVDGAEDHFYYDFGSDNAIAGGDDSFKSQNEVEWIEDNTTNMWYPNVNHIAISTQTTTGLDLDLSNMDADKFVVEGTIEVDASFTPGEIFGTNGEWLGWKMVNITAIDTATGDHYFTEIGRTEVTPDSNVYPFKLKLPNSTKDYIIRIEKISDANGVSEFLEMYLNDGGDNAFGANANADTLKSTANIQWNDVGGDIWIPDTTKTGFFTVSANVSAVAIDITTFGSTFYKVSGSVTMPSGFDMSDYSNNMNVDILDAETGWWISGSPVQCDNAGANCTYSVILGDTLNTSNDYIIQMHQNHWDDTNWENSWWKEYYFDLGLDNLVAGTGGDADEIKNGFDVAWVESTNLDANGYPYHKPNVNPLNITGLTSTVDIDFSGYTAPTTYTITGSISGVPGTAKWANVHLYDPLNYTGNGAELKSDGSFSIQNVKAGKYVLEVNYDIDDNGVFKHYHYIIADDDGDFTAGTTTLDGMDVKWIPYDSSGNSLETQSFDPSFDWTTVSFWAPEETGSQKVMIDVSSDLTVASVTISQPSLYNLITNLSGAGATKNANFNLFVPNEPIGRWRDTTTDGSGDVNATFRDLKSRNDYQLQIWIDGLGEFWYDGTNLVSDVYWVGEQNGTVCDDWKAETWTCDYTDYSNPVVWGPNISGFSINADTTLNLAVPNDRAKVTATLDLSSLSLADGTYVDVNMWEENGNGYAWKGYEVSNNEVNVSLNVKHGGGYNYRMEVWISSMGEGYVVDIGAGVGGADDKLITQQNSWNTSGTWGPKSTTLIPVVDANDVVLTGAGTNSGLVPPTLRTLTFTVDNLDNNGSDVTEQVFIDLEALDASNNSIYEWYGMDNANWSDWQNPTFSNTVTVKVPDNANGYRVMIHPQNHKGGLLITGTGDVADANETIAPGATVTTFSWDWSRADKITVAGDQAYTITLPAAADLKSISGTVSGVTGGDMSGWIHVWSPTVEGNGAEVAVDGTFTIKGLTAADNYAVEYWSWTQNESIKQALGAWETADDSVDSGSNEGIPDNITALGVAKSATVHTFTGTVTKVSAGAAYFAVLLLDVTDTDTSSGINAGDAWEVIEDADAGSLNNSDTYVYTFNVPPVLAGHNYAVAIGVKAVNSTTGATTFTIYNASIDSDNNDAAEGTTAVVVDGITNGDATVTIGVKETHN